MQKVTLVLLLMCLGAFEMFSSAPEAKAANVDGFTVVVEGTTLPVKNACASPCVIEISQTNGGALTYGCFTVSGADQATAARVVAINDNDETLKLENASIKPISGLGDANCYGEMSFWAVFTKPPDTVTPVRIKRYAKGTVMRGLYGAISDWVEVLGDVDAETIYGWERWTVNCSGCGSFEMTQFEDWPLPQMASPREFSVNMNFYLKKRTDILKIAGANTIDIHTEAVGGGGTPHDRNITHGSVRSSDEGCAMCCRTCPEGLRGKDGRKKVGKHE